MLIDRLQIFNHRVLTQFAKGDRLRIAIVGNAGVSKEDSDLISASDCVIRFNNYATRAGITHTKDRARCEVLFTTGDLHSVNANPPIVVIGIPSPFKINEIPSRIGKQHPKSKPYMVNPYLSAIMCASMGINSNGSMHPLPSLGLTCTWNILRMLDTVRGFNPSIGIYGFRWYYDKETKKIQGIKVGSKDVSSCWNHNYHQESRWFIDNTLEHPSFSFGKEQLAILSDIRDRT